jgi:hypothetical protein
MQTSRTRLHPAHRMSAADRSRIERIRAQFAPVVASAWVAAIGQPSPMAGFALAVATELGRGLLRLPAMRAILAAWSRLVILASATLTFQLAAARQGPAAWRPGLPAADAAKRPALFLQLLSNVKQQTRQAGYHFADDRPQHNMQHPPRSTS